MLRCIIASKRTLFFGNHLFPIDPVIQSLPACRISQNLSGYSVQLFVRTPLPLNYLKIRLELMYNNFYAALLIKREIGQMRIENDYELIMLDTNALREIVTNANMLVRKAIG